MAEECAYSFIEGDHDVVSGEALARGWCHKHGSIARLMRPKRGKAALRAEIQGQGKEVQRGRNVFKRCARTETWCLYTKCNRKHNGHSFGARLRKSGKDTVDSVPRGGRRTITRSKALLQFSEDLKHRNEQVAEMEAEESYETLLETSSLATNDDSVRSGASGSSFLRDLNVQECPPTAWERAVARAELAAQEHGCPQSHSHPHPPNEKRRQRCQRRSKSAQLSWKKLVNQLLPLENQLVKRHNVHLLWKEEATMTSFDRFRRKFLEDHGMHFSQSLQACFRRPISLKPTPLESEVENRFFGACNDGLEGRLLPAFHGTTTRKLKSIHKKGLLIPGVDNDLKVANGSAHGLGIYTATVDNPGLSWSFCRGEPLMLICGVLSDAARRPQLSLGHMGTLAVAASSNDVLHVGNAIVIFDIRRVAPLFVATPYVPVAFALESPAPKKHRMFSGPRTRFARTVLTGAIAFLSRRAAEKRRSST